ncbi:hypothetical protein NAL32_04230 [Chryseobacterium sp. Ch-15]|uniref:Uncharacterized protein n=1 Tax=Chryseobacterium muglaense TaxID=2893752 RepID=A0A9Q3URU1_9FLAO|nr:hypothetical protein [Chryseobacterium muglaense]MBD3903946.1 hypothetical protein [Chryseobacterium muglaense]MCC9032868.1 hypothetical protein [Chryseobacterium muglaense]MCM2553595.1 hypothetical protein [Chryseobacterium muglaense]
MDKNIRKQLKTDYENLEINPSENLWEQIELGLDSNPKTAQKPLFQWWKYAAVIIFLLSFGTLFYYNSDQFSASKETIVSQETQYNRPKAKKTVKSIIPTENVENLVSSEIIIKNNQKIFVSEKLTVESRLPETLAVNEKENRVIEVSSVLAEKFETPVMKPIIAERKKASYINAEDLLLGRELDKTRVEIKKHRQFGVLDAAKLKFKRPSSLQVFGVHVFADSIVSK